MTDLIKRLEEAEEGCRELDGAIAVIFGWTFERRIPEFKSPKWWPPTELETKERTEAYAYAKANPPAFTTSLDAAVALAERVLPGWHYELTPGRAEIAAEQWSYYDSAEDEGGQSARAKTTPLALCAAILKATDTGRE